MVIISDLQLLQWSLGEFVDGHSFGVVRFGQRT